MKILSKLKSVFLETLAADPVTLLGEGRMYWDNVNKKLKVHTGASFANIGGDAIGVGTVMQSILSLAQFQSEMGTNWVLMDGADVTGSALATLTGNNTLPDATGRFLRSAGGSAAALAVQQTQATAKNGLGLSWYSTNIYTNTTGSHWHYGVSASVGSGTIVDSGYLAREWTGGGDVRNYTLVKGNNTPTRGKSNSSGNHNHYFNKNNMNSNQSWSSDSETRPLNLTVNTFIKIN